MKVAVGPTLEPAMVTVEAGLPPDAVYVIVVWGNGMTVAEAGERYFNPLGLPVSLLR